MIPLVRRICVPAPRSGSGYERRVDLNLSLSSGRHLLEEPRHPAIGEDFPFRLAAWAVRHFVGLEGDARQRVAAGQRTRLTEAAVDCESTAEARLGEPACARTFQGESMV